GQLTRRRYSGRGAADPEPVTVTRVRGPVDRGTGLLRSPREHRAKGLGQNFRETPTAHRERAVLERGRQIQTIARAGDRHVEETLRFLALAETLLFVAVRDERTDGHILSGDADRPRQAARTPREV